MWFSMIMGGPFHHVRIFLKHTNPCIFYYETGPSLNIICDVILISRVKLCKLVYAWLTVIEHGFGRFPIYM